MKISRQAAYLINLVIILLGIMLVLLEGYLQLSIWQKLMEAIGIGLIAAGLVNFFALWFAERGSPSADNLIEMIATSRITVEDTIKNRKYQAKEVDILGISLSECLAEIAGDPNSRMLNRVLRERVVCRLMFLDPYAHFMEQKAIEDSNTPAVLTDRQRTSVQNSVLIFKKLYEICRSLTLQSSGIQRRQVGNLEIRLIDTCPHMTIDRADDEICWGLYTSATAGVNLSMFRVVKSQGAVFEQLFSHFEKTREINKQRTNTWLVSLEFGADRPALNEALAVSLLGREGVEKILDRDWQRRNGFHLSPAETKSSSRAR